MKNSELTVTSLIALGVLVFSGGCYGSRQATSPDTQESVEPSSSHSPHGAGPHEGTLADWGGGKYHVEFTIDHDKQEATVYILGGDERTPAPIPADEIQLSISDPVMQVTLNAMPQEGELDGASSRFVGRHESLGIAQEYAGTITGVVDGTPYSGDFKEEPHGVRSLE